MPEQHQIQFNLPGLLRMLGENIYAEPDVAIREMIQNAHDSCIIRGTEDRSYQNPQIHVSFDKAKQTIVIADNGTGMTEEGLHKNLATIGESFTRIQREQLRKKDAHEAALLIGQFGIGLLSAFSISRQVEIITRSSDAEGGFRWVCAGDIHYSVEASAKPEPGTRVILHLHESKIALLDEERLHQAVKKYADFLSIPIYLNGNQIQNDNQVHMPGRMMRYLIDIVLDYPGQPVRQYLVYIGKDNPTMADGLDMPDFSYRYPRGRYAPSGLRGFPAARFPDA